MERGNSGEKVPIAKYRLSAVSCAKPAKPIEKTLTYNYPKLPYLRHFYSLAWTVHVNHL